MSHTVYNTTWEISSPVPVDALQKVPFTIEATDSPAAIEWLYLLQTDATTGAPQQNNTALVSRVTYDCGKAKYSECNWHEGTTGEATFSLSPTNSFGATPLTFFLCFGDNWGNKREPVCRSYSPFFTAAFPAGVSDYGVPVLETPMEALQVVRKSDVVTVTPSAEIKGKSHRLGIAIGISVAISVVILLVLAFLGFRHWKKKQSVARKHDVVAEQEMRAT